MYHPLLLEHFKNPKNAGELEAPDAVVEVSNQVCGDVLKLAIRVASGRVTGVRFKCRGCVAAIACGSAVTEVLAASDLPQAAAITAALIEQCVGELPRASKHAAALAAEAVREVLSKIKRPPEPQP